MIAEDYVSFETAKLLKEKGFNAEIDTYYSPEGELKIWCPNGFKSYLDNKGDETWWWKCIAPTQQMTRRWLRKVHNINIEIKCTKDNAEAFVMTIEELPRCLCRGISSNKYEEACEAAIKYCLKNLI